MTQMFMNELRNIMSWVTTDSLKHNIFVSSRVDFYKPQYEYIPNRYWYCIVTSKENLEGPQNHNVQ